VLRNAPARSIKARVTSDDEFSIGIDTGKVKRLRRWAIQDDVCVLLSVGQVSLFHLAWNVKADAREVRPVCECYQRWALLLWSYHSSMTNFS
jgi:hypothetical protein